MSRLDPLANSNMVPDSDYTASSRYAIRTEARLIRVRRVDAGTELHDDLVWNRSVTNASRGVDIGKLQRWSIKRKQISNE